MVAPRERIKRKKFQSSKDCVRSSSKTLRQPRATPSWWRRICRSSTPLRSQMDNTKLAKMTKSLPEGKCWMRRTCNCSHLWTAQSEAQGAQTSTCRLSRPSQFRCTPRRTTSRCSKGLPTPEVAVLDRALSTQRETCHSITIARTTITSKIVTATPFGAQKTSTALSHSMLQWIMAWICMTITSNTKTSRPTRRIKISSTSKSLRAIETTLTSWTTMEVKRQVQKIRRLQMKNRNLNKSKKRPTPSNCLRASSKPSRSSTRRSRPSRSKSSPW